MTQIGIRRRRWESRRWRKRPRSGSGPSLEPENWDGVFLSRERALITHLKSSSPLGDHINLTRFLPLYLRKTEGSCHIHSQTDRKKDLEHEKLGCTVSIPGKGLHYTFERISLHGGYKFDMYPFNFYLKDTDVVTYIQRQKERNDLEPENWDGLFLFREEARTKVLKICPIL